MTAAARWTDLARWVGPTPNQGGAMAEYRGLVIHIAEGYEQGTIDYQKNPGVQVSSHFVVGNGVKGGVDGRISQVVETTRVAWTQIKGNGHWLSAEFAGFAGDRLTEAQLDACARLFARMHRDYGVPLKVAADPTDRGLAHHSLGAEHGVDWGHPGCPGPHIIAQQPEIVRRAVAIIDGGSTVSAPTAQQIAAELMSGLREDRDNKGWTGKVDITAGTDLGGGADAAREARDALARVEAELAGLKASVAAILAAVTAPPAP